MVPVDGRSMETYLTFSLGSEHFCAAVRHVHEVMRPAEYTHLPGARPGIRGLINLRGKMLPILDASLPLLGRSKTEPSSGLVLVLSSRNGEVGLLVDDVHAFMIRVQTDVTAPPQDHRRHHDAAIGTVGRDGRLLTLVDLRRLVDSVVAAPTAERISF